MDEVLPLARPNFALVADSLALAAEHVRRCINLPKGDLRPFPEAEAGHGEGSGSSLGEIWGVVCQKAGEAHVTTDNYAMTLPPRQTAVALALLSAVERAQILPNTRQISIGLGDAFIAPSGLGDAFIASIGLGDAFIASQDDTTITSATCLLSLVQSTESRHTTEGQEDGSRGTVSRDQAKNNLFHVRDMLAKLGAVDRE
ncbi:hypothetical protein E4U12_002311 [Claviceps purpurea]|nr:hypothetical protein E4U12_002311 [Claviceps purpurea]